MQYTYKIKKKTTHVWIRRYNMEFISLNVCRKSRNDDKLKWFHWTDMIPYTKEINYPSKR